MDELIGKETRSVVVISIVFVAVFTSYNSIQNLQSSVNQEEGLGVLSLMCVYGTIIVSAIFAPVAIRTLSAKGVIILSCCIHILYAASNYYPTYWTILPASVILGSISGLFWAAQGTYITTCAYLNARRRAKDPDHVLGKYFSMFSTIFVASAVIGNIMSSVLLNMNLSNDNYLNNVETKNDTTLAINSTLHLNESQPRSHNDSNGGELICAVDFCPYTSRSGSSKRLLEDRTSLYVLIGAFIGCIAIGLGIAVFFLPPLPKVSTAQVDDVSFRSAALACAKILKDKKMMLLCPSFVAFGWAQSFRWTDITQAYISCVHGVAMVGFLMATRGVFQAISNTVMARVAKHVGRARLIVILTSFYIAYFLVYMFLPEDTELYTLFILLALHGALEGPINAQLRATLGLLYESRKEAAFAGSGLLGSLSNAVYFGISNYVCVRAKLIALIVLYVISVPTFIMAEKLYRTERGDYKNVNTTAKDVEMRRIENKEVGESNTESKGEKERD